MDKKVFKSGSPVTPEFLNALQDLSFKKSESEVGHLPLPETITFSNYQSSAFAMALYQGN